MSKNKHVNDDYAGWGKLLTRPLELFGSPSSSDMWEHVGGLEEGSEKFSLQAFHLHLQVIFYIP
jgi:hypothetical protein